MRALDASRLFCGVVSHYIAVTQANSEANRMNR